MFNQSVWYMSGYTKLSHQEMLINFISESNGNRILSDVLCRVSREATGNIPDTDKIHWLVDESRIIENEIPVCTALRYQSVSINIAIISHELHVVPNNLQLWCLSNSVFSIKYDQGSHYWPSVRRVHLWPMYDAFPCHDAIMLCIQITCTKNITVPQGPRKWT